MSHSESHSSELSQNSASLHIKLSKSLSSEESQLFLNESLFLSRIEHPHVVKLVNCGIDKNGKAFVATETLQPNHNITIISSKSWKPGDDLVSILNVLDFLAFLGLAHGDIKPEHLLRRNNENLVLIDFAQVFSLSRKVLVGTSSYLAPELFWHYGYSIQSDLFSLGLSFIELNYPNETVLELIGKYGSSLKPWSGRDVESLKSSFGDASALVQNLKKMISYCPLGRQKSGKEIARVLIEKGESNWTLEQYDDLIKQSLSTYINRTHWIYVNNPVFSKSADSAVTIKRCHQDCQSTFLHNFNIIEKFLPKNSLLQVKFVFGSNGASICRKKYLRGQLPRVLPSPTNIPVSVFTTGNFSKTSRLESLKLNYDFHICLSSENELRHSHYNVERNLTNSFDQLNELALQRNYSEGLNIVDSLIKTKDLSRDKKLILLSHQAYFLASLGQLEKAENIFNDISNVDTHLYSATVLIEYYSAFGWYLFLRGNTKQAQNLFENAIKLLHNGVAAGELSKAILYNRLASVKWLTDGVKSAVKLNDKALLFASNINKNEIIASILLNRCMYLGDSGDLEAERTAQTLLHKKMCKVKSFPLIINYLHNNAAFCLRISDFDRALMSLQRAYALALARQSSIIDTSHLLSLLGNIFFRSNMMGRAFTAWQEASQSFTRVGNTYSAAKCIQNLAEVHFLSGKPRSALRYLKLADRLFFKTAHKNGCIDVELLRTWYADPKTSSITQLKNLIMRCHETDYVWGEYHGLWLAAIHHLMNKRWQQFDKSYQAMAARSKNLVSPSATDDLKLLASVYGQVKNSSSIEESGNLKEAFLGLLWRKGAVSFFQQRRSLMVLFGGEENIFDNSLKLQFLIKELQIEGRFMGSDKEKKLGDDVKKDKNESLLSRFDVIRKIAGLVDQSKNVDEYISKVLDLTIKTLGATRGAIFITSKYSEEIEILGTSGCKSEDISDIRNISKSLIRHALGGNSIFIRNTASERKYEQLPSLIAKNIKSAICIPLKKENEVIGAVYVDSLHFATQFEDLDKTFLDTFGAIIAGGISTSYRLQKLNSYYQNALKQENEIGLRSSEGLLLPSPEMQEIYKTIFRVSKLNFPVLLLGQTGSGKDVLARMIHDNSEMNTGKFVAINCSAIPPEHLESELFGVAGKAFTNVDERQGKFELADSGTLFLDEIADMPQNLQAKLLRVIETQEVEPVGGSGKTKKITFRLISATNKNIRELVSTGKFREDLYHRINDFVIKIPDLAKRPKDIEVLAHHYYNYFQNKLNVKCLPLPEKVASSLLKYAWPGGIRELSKVVHNIISFFNGSLTSLEGLPDVLREAISELSQNNEPFSTLQITMGKEQLLTTLRNSNYNIREAARMINIPESTLRYQMKKLNIEPVPKRLRA